MLKVVSERECVDPKPVTVNKLIKYVELLKYDIRHKVDNLIKVREQNKPQEKTGTPANSAF